MTQRKKSSALRDADKYFSLIIRSVGACENCGSTAYLQCAHGFTRSYRNTRWDTRNAFCLCKSCHVYFTHRPLEWDDWLLKQWGLETYIAVRRQALRTDKVNTAEVAAELRARWNEIESAA